MILTLFTARFIGAGAISCRHCSVQVRFPDGVWMTLFDDGNRSIYRSVIDLTVVHRCGFTPYYWCPRCDVEREPETRWIRRRGGRGHGRMVYDMTCSECGAELQIRSRVGVSEGEGHPDVDRR